MKLLILFVSLVMITYVKKHFRDRKDYIDVQDIYKIHYKQYTDIHYNFTLTEIEQQIFSLFRNATLDNKLINVRVMGGWVRNKLIGLQPKDIDIEIECETMDNLLILLNSIFDKIKTTYGKEYTDNPTYFRSPYEFRGYGFTKIILFGQPIDIEIMASHRNIVPPYVKLF